MSETAQSRIQSIREGIDSIDKQVLELISDRLGLAMELRDLKGKGKPIWAPDREHRLLQRLVAEKPQNLHPDLVVRVWSTLISASLQAQGALQILHANDDLAIVSETAFPGAPRRLLANDWIEDMVATPHAVGILPAPSDAQTWWLDLARAGSGVFVQTALPKLGQSAPHAYCLAHQPAPVLPDQLCLFVSPQALAQGDILARADGQALWQVDGEAASVICAAPVLSDGDEMPTHVGSFFPALA